MHERALQISTAATPAQALSFSTAVHTKEAIEEKTGETAIIIGAVVQLGNCFDLLNERVTSILESSYDELKTLFAEQGREVPKNVGKDWRSRNRDCLVINDYLTKAASEGETYDTVRGAFTEGEPVYEGAGFQRGPHSDCRSQ